MAEEPEDTNHRDESQEELRLRANLDRIAGSKDMPPEVLFRKNTWRPYSIPHPRVFGLMGYLDKGEEFRAKTWDEFREKLNGEAGLAHLETHEAYLVRYEKEMQDSIENAYEEVNEYEAVKAIEDEHEREEFMYWFKTAIRFPSSGEWIPPHWETLSMGIRKALIRKREVILVMEDALRSIAFKLAILRQVLWIFFVWGEVPSYADLGKEEQQALGADYSENAFEEGDNTLDNILKHIRELLQDGDYDSPHQLYLAVDKKRHVGARTTEYYLRNNYEDMTGKRRPDTVDQWRSVLDIE